MNLSSLNGGAGASFGAGGGVSAEVIAVDGEVVVAMATVPPEKLGLPYSTPPPGHSSQQLVCHRCTLVALGGWAAGPLTTARDRKSTRLNSSHLGISYAVFC